MAAREEGREDMRGGSSQGSCRGKAVCSGRCRGRRDEAEQLRSWRRKTGTIGGEETIRRGGPDVVSSGELLGSWRKQIGEEGEAQEGDEEARWRATASSGWRKYSGRRQAASWRRGGSSPDPDRIGGGGREGRESGVGIMRGEEWGDSGVRVWGTRPYRPGEVRWASWAGQLGRSPVEGKFPSFVFVLFSLFSFYGFTLVTFILVLAKYTLST